jgi:rubredoxin
LIQLSHKYYDQLNVKKPTDKPEGKELQKIKSRKYQCSSCLTVYDEQIGDPGAGISPGTEFLKLPNDYTCSVCDNPKSGFRLI